LFQKELLQQEFVVLKLLQVMLSRNYATGNFVERDQMTLKNPQDVGKAVIALQEDNAVRKQLEAMLKDKAKI
jgi:hypothetical protein